MPMLERELQWRLSRSILKLNLGSSAEQGAED
jgi:hypothetical protein